MTRPTTLTDFALAVVSADSLAEKLARPPADLTDETPGTALRMEAPGRPADLQIVPARQAKVPSVHGMPDLQQRIRILHGSANHELQAVELFAWALLAFPAAPPAFRRGLLRLLADEQEHCQLYIERIEQLGARFGEHPVSGYFWRKTADLTSPLRFICAMCLTFETANLDHSLSFAGAARSAGDGTTADIFARIHADELRHVRFGWQWLRKLKTPEQSMWEAYTASLTHPMRPALGRGPVFSAEARRAAGLAPDFIARLDT